MGDGSRRWIIRDASGRIEGPFTTEKVLHEIGQGKFSGEEHIAPYPGGKWIPITQDPQFYDKLLDVLSKDNGGESSEDTAIFDFTRQEDTQAGPAHAPPPAEPEPTYTRSEPGTFTGSGYEHESRTAPGVDETPRPKASESDSKKKSRKKKRRRKHADIELVDVRPQFVKALAQKAKWPLLAAAGGAVLLILLFGMGERSDQRVHLIAPQKNLAQESSESLRPRVQQGGAEFVKDTLNGYLRAQNEFVHVIERNHKNAQVMALLCLTYMQLWPYAYQDSGDTKAIATVLQMASMADPAGVHSSACRTVDLIIRARYQEAKSLVETVMESRANVTDPPVLFYFFKGYLLDASGDHSSAVGYLQSAQRLWPAWTYPFVVEAQALTKLERFGEAGNQYRQILKVNPGHTVARIELGLLEYKHFNKFEQGERYLTQALESDDAPKATLSRGFFGLAELALRRGDQNKALKYAQRAFSLNSSNAAAKNLIVQIGGVEKLRKTKVKGQQLVFEGDQFFREGDCHAAQAHYKAAFEEDQKNALAALKAAQCLWKLSFSTEAIEWLNRAIKADPKLIEAYVTLADYHAQRYDFLAASRVLESAKLVNPKSHEVFRGMALIELRRGNAKGSLGYGKLALQVYDNDVETLIIMAQSSLALRDPKMAYNYANKATEIDVNNRQAQIVFAEALAGLQGVDVGVDYFLKLINNYPLVTEYRLALGKLFLADERYQQADEVFRQVIKLDEKPKEAYVELAKVLRAEGEMNEALDLLLKAAVLDPSDAEPLFLAGTIYLELKRSQEAAVQFQRVRTINKNYPLVHYQMGRAALLSSDPKTALSLTEEEKRLNPNMGDSYLLAADAHNMLGQYSMCATEFQRAIKLRPQTAIIYVKNAQCYRKAGNLDAAMAMLNVASTKESGLADIYKEYGAIYEMKGDVIKAIEAYNQYFVLDPDAPDREQIEGRISALQRGQSP